VLTKRSVTKRAKAAARGEGRTRQRLFAAAAREFSARGFAGAGVDRIARTARLNKALIYYHFGSKAALYRAVLRDMLQAVGARARAVAAADLPPDEKIRRFVEGLAAEAEQRPHFPPIWFREVADGGAHLDPPLLDDIAAVVRSLSAIVGEGTAAGRFGQVNPTLVHAGVVGPLLLFFATTTLRQRLARGGLSGAAAIDAAQVVAHVQAMTLGVLHQAGEPS
jgi:AcrR family transcriptional regulator